MSVKVIYTKDQDTQIKAKVKPMTVLSFTNMKKLAPNTDVCIICEDGTVLKVTYEELEFDKP